jgi:pimeloyl-ACP methyl ester carboxylesterase
VGSGASDTAYYDKAKYGSLAGHADDVIELLEALDVGPVTFVGHSVSAMIGVSAAVKRPELFKALVLVTPSPCYVNSGDHVGGFTSEAIEGLVRSLESNYAGWAEAISPGPDRQRSDAGEGPRGELLPDPARHRQALRPGDLHRRLPKRAAEGRLSDADPPVHRGRHRPRGRGRLRSPADPGEPVR